ncbi:hypothetical protein KC352_g45538, partial [Hortaea werneckii]
MVGVLLQHPLLEYEEQTFHFLPAPLSKLYSISLYFSSSTLNTLPLASSAYSILSTLENPIIGLETLRLIHANATWLIFHPFRSATSCTLLTTS